MDSQEDGEHVEPEAEDDSEGGITESGRRGARRGDGWVHRMKNNNPILTVL